jgi:hypothetical protein
MRPGTGHAFVGISAGQWYEPVADGSRKDRHSFFTLKLIEVLNERTDSRRSDQAFGFWKLATDVQDRVAALLESTQTPQFGYLAKTSKSDFIFVPVRRRKTPTQVSEERLADTLAGQAAAAAREAQHYKAQLLLAEARARSDSPRYNAIAILAGKPVAYVAGHRRLPGLACLHPTTSRAAVVTGEGIQVVSLIGAGARVPLGESGGFGNPHFDARGGRLYARHSNEIRVWDLSAPEKPVARRDVSAKASQVAWGVAVCGRDDRLAVGRPDGSVELLRLPGLKPDGRTDALRADSVGAVAYCPSGRYVAWALYNYGEIGLWDVREKKWARRLEVRNMHLMRLAFTPDGRLLVATGWDGELYAWEVPGLTPVFRAKEHVGFVGSVANSPDGKLIATGGDDARVRLWRTDGSVVANLEAHRARITMAAFTPDGELLVSADADGHVVFWQLDRSGTAVPRLRHGGEGGTLAFAPNGDALALSATRGSLWAHISGIDPREVRRSVAYDMVGMRKPQSKTGFDPSVARLVNPTTGRLKVVLQLPAKQLEVPLGGPVKVING